MQTIKLKITPEFAAAVLAQNTNNRALNDRHVKFLANEMKLGRWKSNGESIKLSNERLIDGQHRLSACVLSGVSFDSLYITELEDDVFSTLDTGKKRNASDVLKIEGYSNPTLLASSARVVRLYETGKMKIRPAVPISDVKEVVLNHPRLDIFCENYKSGEMRGLISPSNLIAFKYLFSIDSEDCANRFFDGLINGIDLHEGSPILALRKVAITNITAKKKLNPSFIAAYLVLSFNAFSRGRSLKRFHWDSEKDFPTIEKGRLL